jgi:hypothetical protein
VRQLARHGADAHRRQLAVHRDDLGLDQIGIADEVGDEPIERRVVQLARRTGGIPGCGLRLPVPRRPGSAARFTGP